MFNDALLIITLVVLVSEWLYALCVDCKVWWSLHSFLADFTRFYGFLCSGKYLLYQSDNNEATTDVTSMRLSSEFSF